MAKQGLADSKVKLKRTPTARPARGILNSERRSSTGSDSQLREHIGAEYSKILRIYMAMRIEELAHVAALNFLENALMSERVDALCSLMSEHVDAFCSRLDSLHESVLTTSISGSRQIKEMVLSAHHLGLTTGIDKSNKLASKRASKGRYGDTTSDPKQLAKIAVKKDWEKWQITPADYAGDGEFAQDMLLNYEALKSKAVIKIWCKKWGKTTTVRAE
jgi:hypothetical protein